MTKNQKKTKNDVTRHVTITETQNLAQSLQLMTKNSCQSLKLIGECDHKLQLFDFIRKSYGNFKSHKDKQG